MSGDNPIEALMTGLSLLAEYEEKSQKAFAEGNHPQVGDRVKVVDEPRPGLNTLGLTGTVVDTMDGGRRLYVDLDGGEKETPLFNVQVEVIEAPAEVGA